MILSVSRRTDIPAFYSNWFFEQLANGFVLVPNPINPVKVAKIKLEPAKIKNIETNLLGDKKIEMQGNVEGVVFWTKNPKPMIDKFEKYYKNCQNIAKNTQKNDNIKQNLIKNSQNSLEKAETGLAIFMENLLPATYFLYTLNPYPKNIEANLPPLEERIESFKKLSKYCPVIWRYDPILLADGIDVQWHKKQFEKLCKELNGYTKHCKISFVIETYKGCSNTVHAPNECQKHEILSAFSKIAKENNIQIEACAESGDWSEYNILPSKCIDGEIFEQLLSQKYEKQGIVARRKNNKLDGQRKNCGCMPAIDIGRYDTCRHGCNYCYARKSTPKSMLDEPVGEIYERKTELEFEYLDGNNVLISTAKKILQEHKKAFQELAK
jgi:hypothetical protein